MHKSARPSESEPQGWSVPRFAPQRLTFDAIHLEKLDGCSAGGRSAKYQHATPGKMIRPALARGLNKRTSLRVRGSNAERFGPLNLLHRLTGEREIARIVPATVLTWN